MSDRKGLETVEEKCETCRFWSCKVKVPFVSHDGLRKWDTAVEYEDSHDDAAGECRRYPKPIDKYTNDWCGEYQPTLPSPSPPLAVAIADTPPLRPSTAPDRRPRY